MISPHIYGHFIEHLGGVIYDGIWVGREFEDPERGRHPPAVCRRHEADRRARICAGRAGASPTGITGATASASRRSGRALTTSGSQHAGRTRTPPRPTSSASTSSCGYAGWSGRSRMWRRTSAPGRRRSFTTGCPTATPRPERVSLADERAANGDKEPFKVKYWGVGNESWGAAGRCTRRSMPRIYRRFVTQFPAYVKPFLVATGPRGHSAGGDLGWTRGFFEAMRGETMLRPRARRLFASLLHGPAAHQGEGRETSTRRSGMRCCCGARAWRR